MGCADPSSAMALVLQDSLNPQALRKIPLSLLIFSLTALFPCDPNKLYKEITFKPFPSALCAAHIAETSPVCKHPNLGAAPTPRGGCCPPMPCPVHLPGTFITVSPGFSVLMAQEQKQILLQGPEPSCTSG